MSDLEHLLRKHLTDWRSGWSMGSFGAIAEFHQDRDELAAIDDSFALTRATRRGAIRIRRSSVDGIRAVAYETLSPKRHRWSQAVALCLPVHAASRANRTVLTELGPDDEAIRGIDRTQILFDMGLALPQCDFCIRTSDPKLLAALRAGLGRSLFDHDNPAMPAILKTHPHRVALTNIGRVEVLQKIGGPDTGGVSPPGPHTHLLPKLLQSGRTHSANMPIPDGFVPVGSLHPGNPVIGPMGEEKEFDAALHADFQSLLSAYGTDGNAVLKQRVVQALERGETPGSSAELRSRSARTSVRLALRQEKRRAEQAGDAALTRKIVAWQAEFEPGDLSSDEEDDAPGH
jgi:hypothetical protein